MINQETISYTVTFNVSELLMFDPEDWDEDMQTMDQYKEYILESRKLYREELMVLLEGLEYNIQSIQSAQPDPI